MGLSFHYSGSIAKPELLPKLIEEVLDIAKIYGWKNSIYETSFPNNCLSGITEYNDTIFGVSITPPACETIFFCFLSNGRMSSPAHLKFFGKSKDQDESPFLYLISVKTQFSNPLIHATIIQIFRYLNQRYFSDFQLSDEGQYWETNNEEILKANFAKYEALLDSFYLGLETIPMEANESFEDYFRRMFELIEKRDRNNQ
ncbi:MAG: hypothetical protein RBS73_08430 [Prolixibacteraceae bacterium]|jgi:hypothetical protein|nr:hypothetical protein [Prolixibacteraceae bacterium]